MFSNAINNTTKTQINFSYCKTLNVLNAHSCCPIFVDATYKAVFLFCNTECEFKTGLIGNYFCIVCFKLRLRYFTGCGNSLGGLRNKDLIIAFVCQR